MSVQYSWRMTALALCVGLTGCSAAKVLNDDVTDNSSSISQLIERQVVDNLGKFAANPNGIPSQASISSGSVTVSDEKSLNLGVPLNPSATTTFTAQTAAGAVLPAITNTATNVMAGATLTPSANRQVSQNWSVSPNTDSDVEKRLRALYRYATYYVHPDASVSAGEDQLCHEYQLIYTQGTASAVPAPSDDDADWVAAATDDSVDSYQKYKNANKNGAHVPSADMRIAELRTLSNLSAAKPSAGEESLWKERIKRDTPSSYADFLSNYPNGVYAKDANTRMVQLLKNPPNSNQAAGAQGESNGIRLPSGQTITATAIDSQFLLEPGCVICSMRANVGNIAVVQPEKGHPRRFCPLQGKGQDLYISPYLHDKWLRIAPANSSAKGDGYIGTAAGLDLFIISSKDYYNFVLATQEALNQGSTAGSSGKSGPSGGGGGGGGKPSPNVAQPEVMLSQ